MASVAASVGHHPALSSALRDGSSLASASGVCGSRAFVVGSPEISLSRTARLSSSVRALRQFQQRSSGFTESAQLSNVSTGSGRHIRARAVSGDNKAVEGEEEKSESTSSTEKPSSSAPSPFAAGKISSKIASKPPPQQAENGKTSVSPEATNKAPSATPKTTSKPATPSVFVKTPAAKPSISVKPKSLIDDGSAGAFPTGKVSPFAADRLKSQMLAPPSQYNRASSGRTLINSGKQVIEAFRQGEKGGKTTKFGQPMVPKNIFDDAKQTQEEKDANQFSFALKPGDIFLVFSFMLTIGLMLGTAFVVWKVGAIHFNE